MRGGSGSRAKKKQTHTHTQSVTFQRMWNVDGLERDRERRRKKRSTKLRRENVGQKLNRYWMDHVMEHRKTALRKC